jgi:hypothetical protein
MCFLLVTRPSAHCRASAHFFSEISRLRCATDLGNGASLAPPISHSTPRASGLSAASFAHSSAFSFSGTHLWAGHHRISIVMPAWAHRKAAMFFRAWIAHISPGPGSSDAIRLMATCASVKMATLSGIVWPHAETPSRLVASWLSIECDCALGGDEDHWFT